MFRLPPRGVLVKGGAVWDVFGSGRVRTHPDRKRSWHTSDHLTAQSKRFGNLRDLLHTQS